MKFFKISAKMGHHGAGKFRTMPIYAYANNALDAIDKIRGLPALKSEDNIPYTAVKEVDEFEFMTHFVFNAYYDFFRENKDDTEPVISLCKLSKDFSTFIYEHEFTTHEGRTLRHFCKHYINGDDDTKKRMSEAYMQYVSTLRETKNLD